jgi:hypothetical protein
LSTVFNYAVKVGEIAVNPCTNCTLPKMTAKEREILTLEQARRACCSRCSMVLRDCLRLNNAPRRYAVEIMPPEKVRPTLTLLRLISLRSSVNAFELSQIPTAAGKRKRPRNGSAYRLRGIGV